MFIFRIHIVYFSIICIIGSYTDVYSKYRKLGNKNMINIKTATGNTTKMQLYRYNNGNVYIARVIPVFNLLYFLLSLNGRYSACIIYEYNLR